MTKVKCITEHDPYLTFGNIYEGVIDQESGKIYHIVCDDGIGGYFMFKDEYEVVE